MYALAYPRSFEQKNLVEFLALFPRRDRYIQTAIAHKNWRPVAAQLSDAQIIAALEGTRGVYRGFFFGDVTRFVVLDIDAQSRYHTIDELTKLNELLHHVQLRPCLYRSSDSGGWHLYIQLREWESSREVAGTLRRWLIEHGYIFGGGTLEIFPSGNALRFPIQAGFAWLMSDGAIDVDRDGLNFDAAIDRFMRDVQNWANDWRRAKTLIESQTRELEQRRRQLAQEELDEDEAALLSMVASHKLLPEFYKRGKQYYRDGLIKPGQRHQAILFINHYLWHGDVEMGLTPMPGMKRAAQREQYIQAWLREKHNGFCNAINRGKWKRVEQDIYRATHWTKQTSSYQPYALTERLLERLYELFRATGRIWKVADLKAANEKKAEHALFTLKRARDELLSSGKRITKSALERQSGCSINTVRKYWAQLMSKGSHDRSPYRGLDPSNSCPKDLEEKKENTSGVKNLPGDTASGACPPVLLDQWRRRATETGREIEVPCPPSPLERSTGGKHWLGGPAVRLRHKRLPPRLAGPPHLFLGEFVLRAQGQAQVWEGEKSAEVRQDDSLARLKNARYRGSWTAANCPNWLGHTLSTVWAHGLHGLQVMLSSNQSAKNLPASCQKTAVQNAHLAKEVGFMAGPEQSFSTGDQGLCRTGDGHHQFTYPDAFSIAERQTGSKSQSAVESRALVAEGLLGSLTLVEPDPEQALGTRDPIRPKTGYKDGDGMWHFATSTNDIAGRLKESLWNQEFAFTHRTNPDAYYDKGASELATAVFPKLREYAGKFDPSLLIQALARNEQMYYDWITDGIPDWSIKTFNRFDLKDPVTVGAGQISTTNIADLVPKYPAVFGDAKQFPAAATDKFTTTLLIGAYLDDRIQLLERWSTHPPNRDDLSLDQRLLFDHAFPLWIRGEHLDALIMSYNPAGRADHLNNVRRHLMRLQEQR